MSLTKEAKVIKALNTVKGYLQRDGGDVEFVKLENNIVYVKLKGACVGCPSAQITLKAGIESFLKEEIPEIQEVKNIDK